MTFSRLAPFIQEYLYAHGWTELRPVQLEACRVIFDTNSHLLIAAGTAAGKTEAAFLPILSHLYNHPPQTVGALYISPIKALINDQFQRLGDLLGTAHIPVHAWHGDISMGRKRQVLKEPKGLLQITPESLESLIVNRTHELPQLFGDLQFVVIDEIHAFMGSERGAQILCQLSRFNQLTGCSPRRVGLSATLGDYHQAEVWLASGTLQPVVTPMIPAPPRTIRLAVEHFDRPSATDMDLSHDYYRYLFDTCQSWRCLIFANDRTGTETVIHHLRKLAESAGLPDIYHVHHGGVSPTLRQTAESAMKQSLVPMVTAATLTLELGVDIGHLDRVIQLEAPVSVASFLQRLGRTGRRGHAADLRFLCTQNQSIPTNDPSLLPEQIPWNLLQCIAILQLYLEDRWIEPISTPKYPFSLLYQQTMSTLAGLGELPPAELAGRILTLPPFSTISMVQFRQLLHHWLSLEHLQRTAEGGLILGLEGEKIVRNYKFYATFADREEYTVRNGRTLVGFITVPPDEGCCFHLAGRSWRVMEVEHRRKVIHVQLTSENGQVSRQLGLEPSIHTQVLQRMGRVLWEDCSYPYLQPMAQQRLEKVRQLAQQADLRTNPVVPLTDSTVVIFPWIGTVAFRTLERYLLWIRNEGLGLGRIRSVAPYYFLVELGKSTVDQLRYEVGAIAKRQPCLDHLLLENEAPVLQKYDEFIPPDFRRLAFLSDYLDMATVCEHL